MTRPAGYANGHLFDINESGQAVGSGARITPETPEGHVNEGFLYTGQGLKTLPDCPRCFPVSLNDKGSIAGWTIDPSSGLRHAFLLRSDGTFLDLGGADVSGGGPDDRVSINNQDWVVWTYGLTPFLYVPGRGSMDLNDLVAPFGGRLASAAGINDGGYIAGTAEFGSLAAGDLTIGHFFCPR